MKNEEGGYMRIKLLYVAIIAILLSCGSNMEGEWKCDGGMVDGMKFLGGDKVILNLFGAQFTTTYIKTGNVINIKTDKADLVFTDEGTTLKGEDYFMYRCGNCKRK